MPDILPFSGRTMMVSRYSKVKTVLLALGLSSFLVALNPAFHLSKGLVNLVIDAVVTILTIADRPLQRVNAVLLVPMRKTRKL